VRFVASSKLFGGEEFGTLLAIDRTREVLGLPSAGP
jgi:hypothetical protein